MGSSWLGAKASYRCNSLLSPLKPWHRAFSSHSPEPVVMPSPISWLHKLCRQLVFEVMTGGNEDAASLAESFNVPFRATRMSAREMMTNTLLVEAMAEQSIPKIVKVQEQVMSEGKRREELAKWYHLLQDFKPQLVLCGGVSLGAVPPIAREMGIPALSFSLQRTRPSRYFTPFGFPRTQLGLLNLASWHFLHWVLLRASRRKDGPALEEFFKKPAKEVLMSIQELNDLYACKAAYPSIIAESHALHGDFPEDFNENCVRIGATRSASSTVNLSCFWWDSLFKLKKLQEKAYRHYQEHGGEPM